ncbi:HPP family-domain-containing protein [Roridomyces roridus]|uniref:HPP family-domain-containing protein n=1 Tax=Roridomyces roridus TaxID=1738132 RepID=A0AAD7B219_9AGAR|nr:HPP family-domain-containing protein [Roridomyces roridus]
MSPSRPPVLSRLPTWISHWLGYRAAPPPKRPDYIVWLWSFIGAFGGLSILQAVFGHAHYFIERNVPSIIASYGASAVLCYGAIEAPLAQPRALLGGHFISALIGVCITKLFALLPTTSRFDQLRWLAGSLSTSLAIVAMQITSTTHPPAGATALLAAVNPDVTAIGWYYLPVVLLSSTLILVSALLINNVQRRYPVYWWAPVVPAVLKNPAEQEQKRSGSASDLEKGLPEADTARSSTVKPA